MMLFLAIAITFVGTLFFALGVVRWVDRYHPELPPNITEEAFQALCEKRGWHAPELATGRDLKPEFKGWRKVGHGIEIHLSSGEVVRDHCFFPSGVRVAYSSKLHDQLTQYEKQVSWGLHDDKKLPESP
jgi:hypothetical protein